MKPATPEQIAKLKRLCETNLKFLCKEVLGMVDWDDTLHDDLAKFIKTSGDKLLIQMPRGHLKSSIVTVGYSIQSILCNPNIRICINNAKYETAQEFVNLIQEYLTSKSALPSLYGPFCTPQTLWNKDAFVVSQRTNPKAQPSVMAASIESVLNGKHFDLIINDDLVEPNNVSTAAQIEKVIRFHNECFNLLDPGGRLLDIGTRWSNDDLYGHIIKNQSRSINFKEITPEERLKWRQFVPTE